MAYAEANEELLARQLGYAINRSADKGSSFMKDDRRIWSTRLGWQTADLNNGSYINHEIFNTLSDALKRPL